ncbi:MAG: phage head-tail connector protein [Rhodobacteraceae bacterium]|nr:phage head-tail connector protein [Paracoccaceae bacterium]
MLQPKFVTPPAALPVSLEDMKAWVVIDYDEDDAQITALIEAATQHFDGYSGILGRAIMPQTWRVQLPCFQSFMRLPLSPFQSVTSIKYYDEDNAEQTVSGDVYAAYEDSIGAFISLLPGQSWPSSYNRADAVSIDYMVGYKNVAKVPGPIKTAIMMLVAEMYDNPEGLSSAASNFDQNAVVARMIAPFRRVGI